MGPRGGNLRPKANRCTVACHGAAVEDSITRRSMSYSLRSRFNSQQIRNAPARQHVGRGTTLPKGVPHA